ncbi:MAG: tetratricopeptide repeat protein [Planctomycetota bacterium]
MIASPLDDLLVRAANAAEQGHLQEGIALYREVLALQPEHAVARNNLGCLLLEADQVDEAVAILEADETGLNSQQRANLGYALFNQGELHHAEQVLRTVIDTDPEDSDARNHLGMVLLHRGQTNAAIDQLQIVVRRFPNKVEAWNNLGCALREAGQHDKAVRAIEQALLVDPYNVDARNNMGCIYREMDQTELAIEELQIAVHLEPENPAIHRNLALSFHKHGDPHKALSHLRSSLRFAARGDGTSQIHELLHELEVSVWESPNKNDSPGDTGPLETSK